MYLKLLKTDFKECGRFFMGPFVAIICVGLILIINNTFRTHSSEAYPLSVATTIQYLCAAFIVGIFVLSILTIIKIINNNFYSSKAYLTFSLPIGKHKIFTSNLINLILYSSLLIIMGVFVSYITIHNSPNSFLESMSPALSDYLYSYVVVNFIIYIKYLLLLHLCMAFANSVFAKKYSSWISIVSFATLAIIEAFINSYWRSSLGFNPDDFVILEILFSHFFTPISDPLVPFEIIFNCIFSVIYFVPTMYLLNRHVEID